MNCSQNEREHKTVSHIGKGKKHSKGGEQRLRAVPKNRKKGGKKLSRVFFGYFRGEKERSVVSQEERGKGIPRRWFHLRRRESDNSSRMQGGGGEEELKGGGNLNQISKLVGKKRRCCFYPQSE